MCVDTSCQEKVRMVWVVGRDFLTVSFIMRDTINIPWANAQKLHLEGNLSTFRMVVTKGVQDR